ncbi:MAG: hypothetical protein OXC95_00970 [Dehalococcoidia bacterium]|nr:hypothetical protein [Dehalococcoidia bacterium]
MCKSRFQDSEHRLVIPAILLLQSIETGEYLLNVTGLNAALERAETERDAERIRAEQAEARIRELEERLRRQQE